jgi:hypothetical protein
VKVGRQGQLRDPQRPLQSAYEFEGLTTEDNQAADLMAKYI